MQHVRIVPRRDMPDDYDFYGSNLIVGARRPRPRRQERE
jgi:hypothetical protein